MIFTASIQDSIMKNCHSLSVSLLVKVQQTFLSEVNFSYPFFKIDTEMFSDYSHYQ